MELHWNFWSGSRTDSERIRLIQHPALIKAVIVLDKLAFNINGVAGTREQCNTETECSLITTRWHCWFVLCSLHFPQLCTIIHETCLQITFLVFFLKKVEGFNVAAMETDIFVNHSSQMRKSYFLPPACVLHLCLDQLSWRLSSNTPTPPIQSA